MIENTPNNRTFSSNPRTRIFDILFFFADLGAFFTSMDVRDTFDITIEDACVRLKKLQRWGMVKKVKKKRPAKYEVSEWGKKFLKDQGYIENGDDHDQRTIP